MCTFIIQASSSPSASQTTFILQNHFVAASPTSRAAALLSLSQACDSCDLTKFTLSAPMHVIHSSPLSPRLENFPTLHVRTMKQQRVPTSHRPRRSYRIASSPRLSSVSFAGSIRASSRNGTARASNSLRSVAAATPVGFTAAISALIFAR